MSSPTILVVYQDEMYLRRVREALSRAGYAICTAETAAEAIQEVDRCRPPVVVICPCVSTEERRAITSSVHKTHPKLTVLHLDANHVDDVSKWPIQ